LTVPFSVAIDELSVVNGATPTGATAAGVLGLRAVAAGVVVLGAGGVVAVPGEVTEAGPVTDATEVVGDPESTASLIRAAASTASESPATTATAIIGAFEFEDAAGRVRAAPPQCRHQSWSW
jgi:hypothetical protein